MNTLKRFCMLIVVLMVLSTFSSAYATSFTSLDNNKIVDISSTDKIITDTLLTKTKTIYVATTGEYDNDGLTKEKPKRYIEDALDVAKSGDTIQVA
ncbi:MAG: hypothetical protein PHY59_05070 [Methanobacterium sp.]|nr:hypothetical protein [Methanobacterium sp.]